MILFSFTFQELSFYERFNNSLKEAHRWRRDIDIRRHLAADVILCNIVIFYIEILCGEFNTNLWLRFTINEFKKWHIAVFWINSLDIGRWNNGLEVQEKFSNKILDIGRRWNIIGRKLWSRFSIKISVVELLGIFPQDIL